jgi:hypothetical protein
VAGLFNALDPLDSAMNCTLAGGIAPAGVVETETGVVIRTGEGAIGDRLAEVLAALAAEHERGAV